MGIEQNTARFLFYGKQQGVSFDHMAMLGRQGLFLNKRHLRRAFRLFNEKISEQELDQILFGDNRFSEAFFSRLGAKSIESFDNSSFENATHIHDFNKEIPSEFKERYSVVFDGGSLEHIFNYPVAIKNCMEMVEVGGHFIATTPSNNFLGHGFYQFSPELIYRVFSKANGYELINVVAVQDFVKPKWYAVRDPDVVKSRVILSNSLPVNLLVLAKRVAKVPIFETTPQQSDYVAKWDQNAHSGKTFQSGSSWVNTIKEKLSPSLRMSLLRLYQRSQYGFNKKHFIRFDPTSGKPYPRD